MNEDADQNLGGVADESPSPALVTGFKVVRRDGERTLSAMTSVVPELAKWELEYKPRKWTDAPGDAHRQGYGIALFDNLEHAAEWAKRWVSQVSLEIWSAQGELLARPARLKIDGLYMFWAATDGSSGVEYFKSEWPKGTMLCSKARTIKRVRALVPPKLNEPA